MWQDGRLLTLSIPRPVPCGRITVATSCLTSEPLIDNLSVPNPSITPIYLPANHILTRHVVALCKIKPLTCRARLCVYVINLLIAIAFQIWYSSLCLQKSEIKESNAQTRWSMLLDTESNPFRMFSRSMQEVVAVSLAVCSVFSSKKYLHRT